MSSDVKCRGMRHARNPAMTIANPARRATRHPPPARVERQEVRPPANEMRRDGWRPRDNRPVPERRDQYTGASPNPPLRAEAPRPAAPAIERGGERRERPQEARNERNDRGDRGSLSAWRSLARPSRTRRDPWLMVSTDVHEGRILPCLVRPGPARAGGDSTSMTRPEAGLDSGFRRGDGLQFERSASVSPPAAWPRSGS